MKASSYTHVKRTSKRALIPVESRKTTSRLAPIPVESSKKGDPRSVAQMCRLQQRDSPRRRNRLYCGPLRRQPRKERSELLAGLGELLL